MILLLYIISSSAVDFGYSGQEQLFKKLDFGIDMESRSKSLSLSSVSVCLLVSWSFGLLTEQEESFTNPGFVFLHKIITWSLG